MGQTVYFKGTRADLQRIMAAAAGIYAGRSPDSTGLAQGLQLLIGVEALSLIKQSFIAKARGGADEAGDTWIPLRSRTVAYGRRHPGLKRKRPGERPRGLLTAAQDKRWRQLYAQKLARVGRRSGQASPEPTAADKGSAAAYAWAIVKAEGAMTILEAYGPRKVEILRDTGQLFASLSPGVNGPSGHPDQILRAEPGAVIVGTNRKGAAAHHNGSGHMYRRPLWPEPDRWPASWWDRLTAKARQGYFQILLAMLRAGGRP